MLTRALLRRGEREAAAKVLETGWNYIQKRLSRKEWETQRANYFRLLNQL